MYPVSEYRNSNEFAEWLNRYNRLNHADLTTKTAPEYLLVEFVEMGINGMEVERLTAENAKLRHLLSWAADTIADLSGGGQHLVIMQEIDSWLTDNAN